MLDLATQALFPRPSLTFVLGAFGSKKTWLGLDLAVSVAMGRQGPAAPALFLDEDHGPSELLYRLRSIFSAYQVTPEIPFNFSSFSNYDFANLQEVDALASQARSVGAGLIVIDQPPAFGHLDVGLGTVHNVQPSIANLSHLAQSTNSAVVVLVHTRKRRTWLADALIALGVDQVLGVDSPIGESWVHLRTLASRSGVPVSCTFEIQFSKPFQWKASLSRTMKSGIPLTDPKFIRITPSSLKPSPPLGSAGFAVLRYLAANGSSTRSQLIAHVTAAVPGRVRNLIKELSKDGYICRTNPGGKGIPAIYALTPAGKCLI
jgi:hypothetical protein